MRKRTRGGQHTKHLFLLVGAGVLLFAAAAYWQSGVRGLLWRALSPVFAVRNTLTASEATLLKSELAAAVAARADRDLLLQENKDLKQRLGRSDEQRRILAGVLLRPPGIPYDTLIVDAGAALGVAVGDLVVAGGAGVVGRVVEVYPTTARVILLSAPGEGYDALISLSDAQVLPVRVEGQGSGSMRAQVPAGSGVVVGAGVVLPGVFAGYTGTVTHVDAKEGESFETLYMQLPANPLQLRFVEIVKNHVSQ